MFNAKTMAFFVQLFMESIQLWRIILMIPSYYFNRITRFLCILQLVLFLCWLKYMLPAMQRLFPLIRIAMLKYCYWFGEKKKKFYWILRVEYYGAQALLKIACMLCNKCASESHTAKCKTFGTCCRDGRASHFKSV